MSFLHLEKCGGIAVMQWLARHFHPAQIERDLWRDLPPNFYWRGLAGLANDSARFPLVWGHYDVPTLRRLAPGHFTFTMLREPRARLLSLYRFWRSVDPAQVDLDLSFSVAMAHRLSLEDFLNCDDPMLLDLTDNLYVRRLTGLYATGAPREPLAGGPGCRSKRGDGRAGDAWFCRDHRTTGRKSRPLGGAARHRTRRRPDNGANVAEDNSTPTRAAGSRQSGRIERSPAVEAALDRRTALDQALYSRALAGFAQRQPDPL